MIHHFVHLEDDPQLLAILRTALNNIQPDVVIAQFANSADLLDYMQNPPRPVDMMMLDIRIVGAISGLEAAAKIRAMGYTGPMIVSSAYEAPPRSTLTALGADYIPKPWRIEALLQRLLEKSEVLPASLPLPQSRPAQPQAPRRPLPAEVVTFSIPLKRTLEHIARLAIQSLQVQGVVMLVADAKSEAVQYFNVYPSQHIAHDSYMTMAAQIMRDGKPVLLPDAMRQLGSAQTMAFAGVPLNLKGMGLGGSLSVYDLGVHPWTETDVALLHRAAEIVSQMIKLSQTASDLAEHNKELNAYTDIIAHDLKTPLSAIINYVEMIKLLFSATLTPEVSQYLGQIGSAADTMKDMITELLWMARLDNPIDSIVPVDMNFVVESALSRLDYALQKRGVQVTVAPELPPVLGHDVWIEEVLANLISNAIKYMGDDNPAPAIRIRAVSLGVSVRYEVEDNGIGISADDQDRLFQYFARLNKIQVEGLGLGLAIVHRMISRLNGEVGLVSEEGAGSTFWFTLPAPR